MLFGVDKQNFDLLTTKFQQLGLRKYDSQALAVMCIKGPSTALKVSENSGVPMTKTYQVLYSLRDKDLITVSMGRPKTFDADLSDVVQTLINRRKQSFMQFKKELKKIPQLVISDTVMY